MCELPNVSVDVKTKKKKKNMYIIEMSELPKVSWRCLNYQKLEMFKLAKISGDV